MKEVVLKRISVLISLIGLVGLFIYSGFVDNSSSIGSISSEDVGNKVVVYGEVKSIYSGNVTVIGISAVESIDVVLFEKLELGLGDLIEVTGRVDVYEGEEQIVADVIRRVS